MRHFCYGQIAELLTDADQLVHHALKLPHRLDLAAVNGQQSRITEPLGNGLLSDLTGQQRIRAAFDGRPVGMFDDEKLLGQRAAPQFLQAGELLE